MEKDSIYLEIALKPGKTLEDFKNARYKFWVASFVKYDTPKTNLEERIKDLDQNTIDCDMVEKITEIAKDDGMTYRELLRELCIFDLMCDGLDIDEFSRRRYIIAKVGEHDHLEVQNIRAQLDDYILIYWRH
ncbi:MAG: hypothetical protein LBH46_01395 [Rickettsiales bacterium]|jgi:hypothetical protein|nr:hypothetical protein [Rickettsiales bacterium]